MTEKSKAKAGPVLKAMLFGFPNPRTNTFGSQNAKGEGFIKLFFNKNCFSHRKRLLSEPENLRKRLYRGLIII